MRQLQVSEYVPPPQFLRIEARGRVCDILLHQPTQRPLLTDDAFGRVYGASSCFIWLCIAGAGRLQLGGRQHRFESGTLVLTDPGIPLVIETADQPKFKSVCVGFTLQAPDRTHVLLPFRDLLARWSGEPLPARSFPFLLGEKATHDLTRRVADFTSAMAPRGMFRYFLAHKAMFEIFCFLVENVYAPDAADALHPDAPLMRVRIEIERRYDQPLTLRELASLANLSPKYLCRAFRKAFGATPLAYRQELRLREAQRLLSTSDLRIGEIAANIGFQSVYHFSRLFRKRTGCTPTTYALRRPARHFASPT
jgi:AraC-like DNA-binding protein